MFISIIEKNVNIIEKEDFIKKYNLIYIGKYKSYDIQNVKIISNKDRIDFYKVKMIDKTKYNMKPIIPFSFYDVRDEKIYDYYERDNIILKSYIDYFDIELMDK
tara:strand:- start:5510 stop:5821 length:312 start_codon:yes stop_codon:yes gene_type:complete